MFSLLMGLHVFLSLRPAGAGAESAPHALSPGACSDWLDRLEDTVDHIKRMSLNVNFDLEMQELELDSIGRVTAALAVLAAPFTGGLSVPAGLAAAEGVRSVAQIRHHRENRESMNEIYDNLLIFKKGIRQIQKLVNYLQHQFPRFGLDSSALVQMDSQIDKVVDAINDFSDLKCLPDVVKQCYAGINFLKKKVPELEASVLQLRAGPGGVPQNRQLQWR